MYKVLKRDGKVVDFDVTKISEAIKKSFIGTNREYHPTVIDMLALRVTSDFEPKIKDGLISVEEIDLALRKIEASLTGDEHLFEDMSPSNRDAVCFPVRLLRLANTESRRATLPTFSELAKQVGRTKEPYNDQM